MTADAWTGEIHQDQPIRYEACDLKLAAQLLDKMIVLATNEFAGRVDKQGMPYILHCHTVAHKLRTDDLERMAIGYGHDLIEDRGKTVTYKLLEDMGFTPRIIAGIRCMTKVPGETYDEYKIKVKSNWDSILVKMADLRHNMDLRRLKGVTDKDLLRTLEYTKLYHELNHIVKRFA